MTPGRIPPGSCPGGLVAVLYDDGGEVVEQVGLEGWPGQRPDVDDVATWQAEQMRDNGGSVVLFDGDSGRPLVVLLAGAVIVLGSPT